MLMIAVGALLAAGDVKLAVLDFKGVETDGALLAFASETYAARLTQGGHVTVITSRDVANLLGLERQKELLGCSEEGACNVELAGALGADAIASGHLAHVGDQLQLTVRIMSGSGKAIAGLVEAGPPGTLGDMLARLAVQTRIALVPETAPAPEAPRASKGPWVTIGAGVVAAAVGGIMLGLAKQQYDAIVDPMAPVRFTDAQAMSMVGSGKALQYAGIAALTVGALAIVAGLLWKLLL